ncbi:tetrahydrofolylpolyglutamate synthase [Sclerotinia borealis F-4128]|uniref:Folylpolyglutamate synthase n=1 Tax=Sclerotinia borealis (strain F-4128) TaxID=1432307 RepID=W9CM44_SCLBF|nr:tetrahydrofolylpolyglutamate synthase [Sclerotinia borealis F-4128]
MEETHSSSLGSKCNPLAETEDSQSYSQNALHKLNRLRTNFESRKQIIGLEDRTFLLEQMVEWFGEIGYSPADFDVLNAIHIAGSKGKGSTAAFIFSILSEYLTEKYVSGEQTPGSLNKIGLYTSPHMRSVRERIRIRESRATDFMDTPLDEKRFAQYLSELWDRLGIDNRPSSQSPPFAKFLTLMGLHTFIQEKVDTAVVEVCIGGRYDSTNIFRQPSVCAITSLGLEHTDILGSTIEEIAWAKGGIMKAGIPVFTAPQEPGAMAVLEDLARKEGADLQVITTHPDLDCIELGLPGDFQRINASLAIAVAAKHLSRMGYYDISETAIFMQSPLPEKFRRGLENARWPGRCETRQHQGICWLLDGAHTMESIGVLGAWAAKQMRVQHQARRVLIFNQQTKDATALLRHLWQIMELALSQWPHGVETIFHSAIFCTNILWEQRDAPDLERASMMYSGGEVEDLVLQRELAMCWSRISKGVSAVTVVRTVEEAVRCVVDGYGNGNGNSDNGCRGTGRDEEHVDAVVLITGSLHLVGSAMEFLDTLV